MLRKIRIIMAAIFFLGVTLLFLDFTGTVHAWLGWMAKIQFLPAVLAANVLVIAGLVILTLLFGRVYCSVICPLGVMQDIISWTRGRLKKKNRFRFSYSPANNWMRYGMLALFIIAIILGIHSLVAILAPYSAYGRIASNLFAPVWQWGNNLLADWAERADSYSFYSVEIWIKSMPVFIIAIATFIIVFILAWTKGRTWCNTVCPVGTILGFLSRFSLFAPVIDTEKCRNCGLCGKQCKSSCINMKEHKIDYSRCVACMDCIGACKEGAIHFALRYPVKPGMTKESHCHFDRDKRVEKSTDQSRRQFLTTSVLVITATALKAQDMKVDGGLADVSNAMAPQRRTPIVPAGSESLSNFNSHCTGCQLCVSVCPNQVLRPSSDLETLMQPVMSYERGYCRPECNKCSQVCPAGAIKPITKEEKSSIQIGHAVVNLKACVVNTDNVKCGNCARHCKVGAIRMVRKNPEDNSSPMIPVVNVEKCIGCGACENLCPARPLAAIHVEGNQKHRYL
ncbi:MAG: 4Fe-4S dicluster domain-containing protein [Bacteroidales bacterium]|nr:4Fe-4S dicluster domain-containing protein [Bacteroidales bacterium]